MAVDQSFRGTMAQLRLDLRKISVLIVDRNHYFRALIAQTLRGFEIKHVIACETAAAALEHLSQFDVDLCLIDSDLPDIRGEELVKSIRRMKREPLRFVPIIMLAGYTQLRMVGAARDAGANIVLKKPFSPRALFDQIGWLARTKRPHIEAGSYVGPDRQFHVVDPPMGGYKRTKDELTRESSNNPTSTPAEQVTR